ncbi:SDR family oxidoreductase [uncultured Tessaracoccus sp.]|uniref:SDR family NAD(P)-dependent oxidoreductase n=1 Tax=uncultured Tessaracoccus sp. TaxID=905023 RepID=UPI0025F029FF|nr:SDR family oxidoreductase [uncultured Tessaracoccus sp.]
MESQWAVVTGASAGLGAAFADHIAAQGSGVILAARREDRLEEVAAGIRARHGVPTKVRPVDLASEAGRAEFVEEVRHTPVHTLVNNAGFGSVGEFTSIDAARLAQETSLNVGALTELTRAVVVPMVDRGRGAIINVASTAAFQPMPEMAVYAASKGYVLQFTIALWEELLPTGVRAVAICPGPTDTEFFANAGDGSVLQRRRTPQQVVDATFRALQRHDPFVVDGLRNRALALANRFAPRSVQARVARLVLHHA